MARSPKARRTYNGRKRGNNHIPAELTIEREARAWELKALGYSALQIAGMLKDEFGKAISKRGVNLALQRVAEQVESDAIRNAKAYKGRQIARLEAIADQALTAYRQSIGEQIETVTRLEKGGQAGDFPRTVAQSKKVISHGDPRHLNVALEAMRDLRRMLGHDAPLKIDLPRDRPYEGMTDDELEALIASKSK